MFQSNTPNTESDFNEMLRLFNEIILKGAELNLTKDKNEWDMKSDYKTTWASIWNRVELVEERVKILEKNDEVAIVQFMAMSIEQQPQIASRLYRLEDLQKL